MLKKAGDHAYFFVRVILKMLDITDRENPADKGSYIVGFNLNIQESLDSSISVWIGCPQKICG